MVMALSGQLATASCALSSSSSGMSSYEADAVTFVVGLEHLGCEHVAAAVTGARLGVDA